MRFSDQWLREWVRHNLTPAEVGQRLTMAGIELDALEPAAPEFSDVVVARVTEVEPHPQADKLRVCQVDDGAGELKQVVCGAPNVTLDMRAPFARVGAVLPDGQRIEAAELRGVASAGMLCSAQELGLGEGAAGLLALAAEAPVGEPLGPVLGLDDMILEVDLTPNRGDCLSIAGLAREVSAITEWPVRRPPLKTVHAAVSTRLPVTLDSAEACPCYIGRVLEGIDAHAQTPLWLRERLRRSGIRSLGPVVDVTNYVMLELGQPLHAFDLDALNAGIHVRQAVAQETLTLLDGQTVTLTPDVLVIADTERALAMAGIMGGADSAVSGTTRNIFLESAFFTPVAIAGRARCYGLHTDASHRFERGVDPEIQVDAIERATQLLMSIVGGEPGPLTEARAATALQRDKISLRVSRVNELLGIDLRPDEIREILARLGCQLQPVVDGWLVLPPSHRFDLAIEEDLIEEVARIYGYDRIPSTAQQVPGLIEPIQERVTPSERLQDLLVDRGYQEVITYSFVDAKTENLLAPTAAPLALANPLSAELAVMRTTLWSGLLKALRHNLNRQETRLRLFETGLRFLTTAAGLEQTATLAGVATGARWPEQWAVTSEPIDFFDIKGDVEALLALTRVSGVRFEARQHAALHPGQTAALVQGDEVIGWLGALHPQVAKQLDIEVPVFLFEISLAPLSQGELPEFTKLSSYPAVRRDIAAVVPNEVTAERLQAVVRGVGLPELRDCFIFDVFTGKGVPEGHKSIAFGLILQDLSRTLTDEESDAAVQRVVAELQAVLGATLRV